MIARARVRVRRVDVDVGDLMVRFFRWEDRKRRSEYERGGEGDGSDLMSSYLDIGFVYLPREQSAGSGIPRAWFTSWSTWGVILGKVRRRLAILLQPPKCERSYPSGATWLERELIEHAALDSCQQFSS